MHGERLKLCHTTQVWISMTCLITVQEAQLLVNESLHSLENGAAQPSGTATHDIPCEIADGNSISLKEMWGLPQCCMYMQHILNDKNRTRFHYSQPSPSEAQLLPKAFLRLAAKSVSFCFCFCFCFCAGLHDGCCG